MKYPTVSALCEGVVIGYAKIENGEYEDILAIVSAKLPLQYGDEYKSSTLKEVFVDAGIWDAISPMLLEITETEYYNLD